MNSHVYGRVDEPLHGFDWYPAGSGSQKPLICFIHGGAWRSEDKAQHSNLVRSLQDATGCPVAVPNYRLTPAVRHPLHAQDVLAFLEFIVPFASRSLVLIGHSCSAHILTTIFLDSRDPTLRPSAALSAAVSGIVMSEGIYDLDALLASFPSYQQWFIEPAFGPPPYPSFSALTFPLRPESSSISWLLLHSKGDTLVDEPQTLSMHRHLLDVAPGRVQLNIDHLIDGHDDILRSEKYVNLVRDFVQMCSP